jgi:hypothetical protein
LWIVRSIIAKTCKRRRTSESGRRIILMTGG